MGGQAVCLGAAQEGPQREPWGKMGHRQKPGQERQHCGQGGFPFAASRLRILIPQSTAEGAGLPSTAAPQLLVAALKSDLRPRAARQGFFVVSRPFRR